MPNTHLFSSLVFETDCYQDYCNLDTSTPELLSFTDKTICRESSALRGGRTGALKGQGFAQKGKLLAATSKKKGQTEFICRQAQPESSSGNLLPRPIPPFASPKCAWRGGVCLRQVDVQTPSRWRRQAQSSSRKPAA